MSASDDILLERRGALGIVTLNRPKALNTLSLAMYRVMDRSCTYLEVWRGVGVNSCGWTVWAKRNR